MRICKPNILALLLFSMLFLFVGCSDDSPTGTTVDNNDTDWTSIQFADYGQLIEKIAPPVYESPQSSPSAFDDWTTGDYPLLGKVFSESEPMSLYWNLETFEEILSEIEMFLLVNDSGDIMVDSTAGDSSGEGNGDPGDYIEITELTTATTIPSGMDSIIGTSVTVENLITFNFPDMEVGEINQIGFTLNDDEQTILAFHRMHEEGTITMSMVYYAHFDAVDSSIIMKGVALKDYGDGTNASWAYNINSVNTSEFAYRMSWYSDDIPGDDDMLACIIGGGDKDVEFALKYRQYIPANSTDHIADWEMQQVFGSSYSTEGESLITAFSAFVSDDLFFGYGSMPTELLNSPWAE